MTNINKLLLLSSLYVLAIFSFTSFSLTAASHIFIFASIFTWFKNPEILRSAKLSKSALCLIGFIFTSVISVLLSSEGAPLKNIFNLKYHLAAIISILGYSWMVKNNYLNSKHQKILLIIAIATTAIASFSGLIAYFSGFNPLRYKPACHPTRTCGMYGMCMTYAYGIQFVCLALVGLIVHYKQLDPNTRPPKWLLFVSTIINSISFILSFARGTYLGVIFSLPFVFLHLSKKLLIKIFLSSILITGLVVTLIPQVRDELFTQSRNLSNYQRISQFNAAIKAFQEYPLLGYGYKNFESNSSKIKNKYKINHAEMIGHAHSNFFEVLASTGIIGLLFFIAFQIFWYSELVKRKDVVAKIILPIIIAFFVSGQFQYTFGDGENMFVLMAIYALSQIKLKENENV